MAKILHKDNNNFEKLYEIEKRIISVLHKLETIENEKTIDSNEYKSMCGLLQDFLLEEEDCVAIILKDPYSLGYVLKSLNEKSITKLDEALWAFNFTMEESILYRMNKILNACNPNDGKLCNEYSIKAIADEEINIDFLKREHNSKYKYRLAFVNPLFCSDMTQSCFHVEMLYPEILNDSLKSDILYEINRTNYLLKRFGEVFGFIVLNNAKDEKYFNLLIAIKNLLPQVFIEQLLKSLERNGIDSNKINEIYTMLLDKEKKEKTKENK